MESNELRIGNLIVHDDDSERQEYVVSITYDDETGLRFINGLVSEDIKPIPLNEDWLIKFGAKKNGDIYHISLSNLKAEIHFEYYPNGVAVIRSDFAELILDPIEHVHQLQNLYFALTNTELELNN